MHPPQGRHIAIVRAACSSETALTLRKFEVCAQRTGRAQYARLFADHALNTAHDGGRLISIKSLFLPRRSMTSSPLRTCVA